MAKVDFLVVGAGFFGAVFAEQVKQAGKTVRVIERRTHMAGNCFSYDFEDTRINLHQYGTHIFHTNDRKIWDYVNRFSDFNRYQHRVLTKYKGRVYSMPINLGTINQFYGLDLKPDEVTAFLAGKKDGIVSPTNLEEKAISLIGFDLYEAFIKGYTTKQWGCDPRQLPADIITRLPVRSSYYDSYFDDLYQGIPVAGYTPIVERMLENIPVELGVDYLSDREYWRKQAHHLVYTGPLDEYFENHYGNLGWRSVRFEIEKLPLEDFQGTSVMNYADLGVPYTRIHEMKHLHREKQHTPKTTVIVREYSCQDEHEKYYPINSPTDREKLALYQQLAFLEHYTIFGGRLAEYRYYDMHQVIGAALVAAQKALREPVPI